MVLMLLAGCSTKDVAEEYHLSEQGLGNKWKKEVIGRLLKTPPFIGKDPKMVQRCVGARKEVMTEIVNMVEADWGGIENFLQEELKIPEEVLRNSKEALQE